MCGLKYSSALLPRAALSTLSCGPCGREGRERGVCVTLLADRRSGLFVPLMRCWAQPLNTDLAPAAGGGQPDLPGAWGPAAHTSHIGGTCQVHGHPACTPTLLASLSDSQGPWMSRAGSLNTPDLQKHMWVWPVAQSPRLTPPVPGATAQEVPATGASIS